MYEEELRKFALIAKADLLREREDGSLELVSGMPEDNPVWCSAELREKLRSQCSETPYGIPYRPYIWGAGWGIQAMAFRYYFLQKAFPDALDADLLENALHFVLGCHPGSNTASFASGVGTRSAVVAYGANRADWSYIPGGVISGTALIRPDFPELLEYPFLWQQTEYVLGGGSSNFMFLVLAVRSVLRREERDCAAPNVISGGM